MKLYYSYHSEHHATPLDRWRHFLLYLCALLLIYAGAESLFYHLTHWEGGGVSRDWWELLLGVGYLVAGGLLAFFAWRYESHHKLDRTERYVHIDREHLEWSLEQDNAVHRLALADIVSVDRTTIRDLVLDLRDGGQTKLPIYLIVGNAKQEELIRVLVERVDSMVER